MNNHHPAFHEGLFLYTDLHPAEYFLAFVQVDAARSLASICVRPELVGPSTALVDFTRAVDKTKIAARDSTNIHRSLDGALFEFRVTLLPTFAARPLQSIRVLFYLRTTPNAGFFRGA